MKKITRILVAILVAFVALPNIILADTGKLKKVERIEAQPEIFKFKVSFEELLENEKYTWGVSAIKGETPTKYYDVTSMDYDKNEFELTMSTTELEILRIFMVYDKAYLTVKSTSGIVVSDVELDVKIPLLNAFVVTKDTWYGSGNNNAAYVVKYPYSIEEQPTYAMFEKITDEKIINAYLDGIDLSTLPLKGFDEIPSATDNRWFKTTKPSTNESQILNNALPDEDGIYYLWLKTGGTDYKALYGYEIIKVGNVKKIEEDLTEDDSKVEEPKKEETKVEETKKEEIKEEVKNPKTADTNVILVTLGLIASGSLIVISKKKLCKNK